jgi:SNF2 family DNA or RNA helicase
LGFTRRKLKEFQLRDLQRLLALPNGANFSVPGAGKTTVTLALHLINCAPETHLFVVGPKSCFSAWTEIVDECVSKEAPDWVKERFTILSGGPEAIRAQLASGKKRFVINYEQIVNMPDLFKSYLMQNKVHLVLDESHRMKGGLAVKRGIVLLNAATLPVRRDILSGTPMPQGPADLQSQVDFLWPGSGLGRKIARGDAPRDVIGNLYVRTTKTDLGLPPVTRHFYQVGMGRGQAALYGIVRDEALRDLSSLKAGSGVDIVRARRSVMRLLQLSSNPVLALQSIMENSSGVSSGIMHQVLEEGASPKMMAVRDFARELAQQGRKTVIWTIFTDTIEQMERMLADLGPVSVYGAIPSGDQSDEDTREGRVTRFHEDPNCRVFIANPAAAGEGISLHHAAHDAIYLDRSYNSTHYLQSIDRIHRLGLPEDVETKIHIFQTTAPKGLGCVDHSVSRRLATKLRGLQELLDDEDLHRIAFDEETADEPIDYDIQPDDLVDLINEIENKAKFYEGDGV